MLLIKCQIILLLVLAVRSVCPSDCPKAPGDLLRSKRATFHLTNHCFIKSITTVIGIIYDPKQSRLNKALRIVDQDFQVYKLERKSGRLDAFADKSNINYEVMARGMSTRENFIWAFANGTNGFYYLYNSTITSDYKHETRIRYVTLEAGSETPERCWTGKRDVFFTYLYFRKFWARLYSHYEYKYEKVYLRRPEEDPYESPYEGGVDNWNFYKHVAIHVKSFFHYAFKLGLLPCYLIVPNSVNLNGWVIYRDGTQGYFDNVEDDGLVLNEPKKRLQIQIDGPVTSLNKSVISEVKLFLFQPNVVDIEKAFYILNEDFKNFSLEPKDNVYHAKPVKYVNEAMVESLKNRNDTICAVTNSSNYYWALQKSPNWRPDSPIAEFCKYILFYGKEREVKFNWWVPPNQKEINKNKDWRAFVIPVIELAEKRIRYYDFLLNYSRPWPGHKEDLELISLYYDGLWQRTIGEYQDRYVRLYDSELIMPYYIIRDVHLAYLIFKNGTYTTISLSDLDDHRIWNFQPFSAKSLRVFKEKGGTTFG